MKLYEIDEALQACFDKETGELVNPEGFEALTEAREDKIESLCLWVKELTAEAQALRAEKQVFEARQRAAERKAKSLKDYIAHILNGQKFKTTKCAVTFRATSSVNITDLLSIPAEFVEMDIKPDKMAIKKALAAGQEVRGAELVESLSCTIR